VPVDHGTRLTCALTMAVSGARPGFAAENFQRLGFDLFFLPPAADVRHDVAENVERRTPGYPTPDTACIVDNQTRLMTN
jgi:hypothetical protein